MSSNAALLALPYISFGMSGQLGAASLAVAVVVSLGYNNKPIIHHDAFQVFALTLGSILAVAVVAVVLICLPELLDSRHQIYRRKRRGRSRHRTQRGNKSSKKKETLNQTDFKTPSSSSSSSATTTVKLQSSITPSRKKTPSMPPLTTQPKINKLSNSKSTPGLVPASDHLAQGRSIRRRYSSPPSLSLQESSASMQSLNPIAERKLEDLMDYDSFYWRELDSRTQYCALILGYTPSTWDDDFELDDLICEDWDWDDMTKEQKAAAKHFGYNKQTWTDN